MPDTTESVHEPIRTDVLIIGAGPVGLFAAFEAGVIGLTCEVVDTLAQIGGQCTELYPDKPIFDIPAIPVCTARELVERLAEQCRPFNVPIRLGQRVVHVEQREDGRWRARTEQQLEFDAAAILISAGNGAFVPQRLALPDAASLEGRHLHYAVRNLDDFAGRRVVVAGGGDSALDWALALRHIAQHVTLVHRRNAFRAADSTVEQLRRAADAGELDIVTGTITALRTEHGVLQAVDITQIGAQTSVPAEHVIALYGLVADLGPIAQWGMEIRAGRIAVDTSNYESSRPGLFAVGDIAIYPNKQKLILSGFHEAALALRKIYGYAHPERKRVHVHSSYDPTLSEKILGTPAASA
ncbi:MULTISPECIES: NAD(P)/FAD-dependent oxidoreductase [Mycetohabitans]|nr:MULTISPECIES: NAD(P)/FAD-dependent oxidoreductase [Mycetohabitans]MCF7697404.1 NAD(P)/FAD-dependent oxidoreductase [Mycetohabitans sp. B2]MCG1048327.1 NAD(P)/FAD-dependent oxidoreductase [Mycetohabitans sp. B6]